VQLGPKALALAVQMNKGLGMPHADGSRTESRRAKGHGYGGTFDERELSTRWSAERPRRRQRLGAAETRPSVRALALPARRRPARGTLQPGARSSGKPTRRVLPVGCKPPSWSCRSPSRREGYGRGKSSSTGFGDRSEALRTHPGNVEIWKMGYSGDREMDSKRHARL
jgi:hypothetical protein